MTRRIACNVQVAVAILAVTLAAGSARAQVLYGSLTGNVTDPSKAAVPGAKVEAIEAAPAPPETPSPTIAVSTSSTTFSREPIRLVSRRALSSRLSRTTSW